MRRKGAAEGESVARFMIVDPRPGGLYTVLPVVQHAAEGDVHVEGHQQYEAAVHDAEVHQDLQQGTATDTSGLASSESSIHLPVAQGCQPGRGGPEVPA